MRQRAGEGGGERTNRADREGMETDLRNDREERERQ